MRALSLHGDSTGPMRNGMPTSSIYKSVVMCGRFRSVDERVHYCSTRHCCTTLDRNPIQVHTEQQHQVCRGDESARDVKSNVIEDLLQGA
ncbi:hypothetical protein BG000_004700, partial [Podila horticola]